MTQRNKGWRLHHKRRMVSRARSVMKIQGFAPAMIDKHAPRKADNLKDCSCGMCTVYWPSHRAEVMEFSAREQIRESEIQDERD